MENKINDSLKIKHRHDTIVNPRDPRGGVDNTRDQRSQFLIVFAEGRKKDWIVWRDNGARTKPDEGTTGETVLDDRSEEKPRHFLRETPRPDVFHPVPLPSESPKRSGSTSSPLPFFFHPSISASIPWVSIRIFE